MAHGAVFMWGAFVGLFAVTRFGLPFPIAFILAVVLAGLLSVALDSVAFRSVAKTRCTGILGDYFLDRSRADPDEPGGTRLRDKRVLRYPLGTLPVKIVMLFGLRVTLIQAVIVGSPLVIVSALLGYLFYTRFGRQIRAVAVNGHAETLLSINADLVYFQTFFISGALAGAAGVLIGVAFNAVRFIS